MDKKCTKCGEIKDVGEFNKDNREKDGYTSRCRECRQEQQKIYRDEYKEEIMRKMRLYNKNNSAKRRLSSRKYRENNLDKVKAKDKAYTEKHKVERSSKAKIWRDNNKAEHNRRHREWSRSQYRVNSDWSIKDRIRSRINQYIKSKNHKKSEKTEKYIGCTFDYIIIYLDSLGYNRNIHDIDHIIPLSAFDVQNVTHQKMMFHYKNLQPLNPIYNQNIKKGNLLPNWKETITDIANQLHINPMPIIEHIESQNIKILSEEKTDEVIGE